MDVASLAGVAFVGVLVAFGAHGLRVLRQLIAGDLVEIDLTER
jgi:hypothetical protein